MHLTNISFENFMRYRGKQSLQLAPKVYAVTARYVSDPDRSNFAGKSSLLEAVDFALFGRLSKDRSSGADGWITDGEKQGGVSLTFDDGVTVERSRKKSTVLEVHHGTRTLHKEEAQAFLDEHLGVTADDFLLTSYFRQRKLSHFVLAAPQERVDAVVAWFRLAPLERAAEAADVAIGDLSHRAAVLRQRLDAARQVEERELGGAEGTEQLARDLRALELAQNKARDRATRLQDELSLAERHAAKAGARARYEAVLAEGKALKAELEGVDLAKLAKAEEKAAAERDDLHSTHAIAARQLKERRVLARGEFGGVCPVAGFNCPATSEVVKVAKTNTTLVDAAEAAQKQTWQLAESGDEKLTKARAEHQAAARKSERLTFLREQALKLQEDAETDAKGHTSTSAEQLYADLSNTQQHARDLSAKAATLTRSLAVVTELAAEMHKAAEELKRVELELATQREAKAILGKNGAQRRVAERALSQIEHAANSVLRSTGSGLSIELQWSREGTGLAKACEACGQPFPASAKAKECARCGTARGANLVNRLDVALSDQSGGAEDLVGVAIQLSAARWLREDRQSAWSTALVDEPFQALDKANRRELSRFLVTALNRDFGFAQAFLISHSPDTVSQCPGQIEVLAEERRSVVRVIA